ncbi:CBS domain-containing protein [Kamptonema formosum]|uniref:CBS domain-containing protein n=1 Tax=Kamptonema formosum TaxID=331992 RepID=UPI0003493140|nr:CBS domain-containing protein [Oscillatoria sp. PCC 10802]
MQSNSSLNQPLLAQSAVIDRQHLLVSPSTPVTEVITRMSQSRNSCVLVAEGQRLVGIFTERDIVKMSAAMMPQEGVEVRQVMTPEPVAISVSQELDIFSVISIFRQHKIRHLPALDESGKVLGVITQSSIREVLKPTDLLKLKPVSQVMSANVIISPPTDSLLRIAQKMAEDRISCVVISEMRDGGGIFPVGIITERDIVQFRAMELDLSSIGAQEVMSCPLLPIQKDDSVWAAHQLMERHRIRRLVVIDEAGMLAGILTQSTLLEAIDPLEMHATIEILRQQVDARTTQLSEANARLQEEIALRERELGARLLLEKQLLEENAKLQQALIAAESASLAKSSFLANVGHELRSPLHTILGFGQLVRGSQTLTPENQKYLSIIQRSGEHLLDRIENLLELSKMEAGRTSLNEGDFDLHLWLEDLADLFSHRARDKQLEFVLERAPDLPQYVRSDREKLRQVLVNIIDNAIKFTPFGSVRVRVRVGGGAWGVGNREWGTDFDSQSPRPSGEFPRPNPQGSIIFEVEDTGPGIPPEKLNCIFEASLLTPTEKRAGEGMGIGLPVSRFFVRLMGGEMAAERTSTGTLLKFDIQVKPVGALDIETGQPSRRAIAPEPNQPCYRILIVDDQWENRQWFIQVLSPLRFELKEASNGVEAIEVWDTWEPHLIFMDMRMPVMDGYEAAKRIKATVKGQATAVIIALIASTSEEQARVIDMGVCDDVLQKTFRESDILEQTQKHLGVRYIYEGRHDSQGEALGQPSQRHRLVESDGNRPQALTPAAVAALPEALLADLQQATICINLEVISDILDEIRRHNAALAGALKGLVDNFNYAAVLNLIQEAKGEK